MRFPLPPIADQAVLFLRRLASMQQDEVDLLRHRLGFADTNPEVDRDKARHSGMLRYGNEPLAIWGSCQAGAEPEWVAQEIQFAVPRVLKRRPRIND